MCQIPPISRTLGRRRANGGWNRARVRPRSVKVGQSRPEVGPNSAGFAQSWSSVWPTHRRNRPNLPEFGPELAVIGPNLSSSDQTAFERVPNTAEVALNVAEFGPNLAQTGSHPNPGQVWSKSAKSPNLAIPPNIGQNIPELIQHRWKLVGFGQHLAEADQVQDGLAQERRAQNKFPLRGRGRVAQGHKTQNLSQMSTQVPSSPRTWPTPTNRERSNVGQCWTTPSQIWPNSGQSWPLPSNFGRWTAKVGRILADVVQHLADLQPMLDNAWPHSTEAGPNVVVTGHFRPIQGEFGRIWSTPSKFGQFG